MDMKVSSNNINIVEYTVHYYLDTIENTRGSINKINLSVLCRGQQHCLA